MGEGVGINYFDVMISVSLFFIHNIRATPIATISIVLGTVWKQKCLIEYGM